MIRLRVPPAPPAQLGNQRRAAGKTALVSPHRGRGRDPEAGGPAPAGRTILRRHLSAVWVIAKVPAAQAADIKPGQAARVETVALPGQVAEGEVAFVQPIIDAMTRTVDVRIALPNPAGDLRPGLYGTVLLEEPGSGPVLTVPRSAVLDSGTRQVVLVETGPGSFAPRDVTLGRRGGDRIGFWTACRGRAGLAPPTS